MAVMAVNGCKLVEMAGNDWIWLEMTGIARHSCKGLDIDGNGWK